MTPTDLLELIHKHHITSVALCRIFSLDQRHNTTAGKIVLGLVRKKCCMRHAAVAIKHEAARGNGT